MRTLFYRSIFFLAGLLVLMQPAAAQQKSFLADGTLVQANNDTKIYLIDGQLKRWVDSAETFRVQGFRTQDISMIRSESLAAYPNGETVTAQSTITLPSDRGSLPDLVPLVARDLRLSNVNGHTVIRFTTLFWNQGSGKLDVISNQPETAGDALLESRQHIVHKDGSVRDKIIGDFLWHEAHQHYHLSDFANYTLKLVKARVKSVTPVSARTVKTTFCMRDDLAVNLKIPNAVERAGFGGCGKFEQGVSVGWADRYPYTLPDQYIDVNGLPAGVYELSFDVDPLKHFIEERQDNNSSIVLVDLDPAAETMKILAAGSAFRTPENHFPDGMLIKSEGDSKIYVMRRNKKRLIQNEDVFRSYGFSFDSIYTLPAGVVAAMPVSRVMRLAGSATMYTLNDAGYRRKILNPEVFKSYGFTPDDVANQNDIDFASHPDSDLIMLDGYTRVYSINTRRYVGEYSDLRMLGFNPDSVHIINQKDFNAYAVSIPATGLNVPWDIAFLPDGDMLVTERTGTVRRLGKSPTVMTVPTVLQTGEGGLMGIALDPNFVSNKYVYLYFTASDNGRNNRAVRFRLEANKLILDKILIDGIPTALYHDGGQIAFGPDGKLYVTTGDSQVPDLAQSTKSLAGKILRINSDGSIPSDNPYGNQIWSYGHRNPQGLAWDSTGMMYASEHGPTGELGKCCRDELNKIVKGGNYGWPMITGNETRDGMIAPAITSGAEATWAPSGLAFYNGKLYMSGLKGSALYQATVNPSGALSDFRALLSGTFGRLRAAVVGPDGLLYLTTSNRDGRGVVKTGDDKIIKVAPDMLVDYK